MSIVELATGNIAGQVSGFGVLISLLAGAIWRRRRKHTC